MHTLTYIGESRNKTISDDDLEDVTGVDIRTPSPRLPRFASASNFRGTTPSMRPGSKPSTPGTLANVYPPIPASMPKSDKRKAMLIRSITPINPTREYHGAYEQEGRGERDNDLADSKKRLILAKEQLEITAKDSAKKSDERAQCKFLERSLASAAMSLLTEEERTQLKDKWFLTLMSM